MLGTLNPEQIDRVLRGEVVGRLGLNADGRTYVVPVTYAYDGTYIYGHSGPGLKLRMMRANPHICFEVDHMDDLANWRSVIGWGVVEELHGDAATEAMHVLVDRLAPMMASETSTPSHGMTDAGAHRAETTGHEAVVFRVELVERSGRFEKR